jgi:Taurine catabolism dioxygenase TauD, TfdA family
MEHSWKTELIFPDTDFLLAVYPDPGVDPVAWAKQHRSALHAAITKYGGVLIRGLDCDREGFSVVARSLEDYQLDYTGGIGPRKLVAPEVYNSTDLPPKHALAQHHEMSYNAYWPMKVLFYCETPPEEGGATTVCDARQFYKKLDPAIKQAFESKGVQYVRNYYPSMPYKTIEQTFGTTDQAAVDAFCSGLGIETHWRDAGTLKLIQRAPAVRQHPLTADRLFFNTVVLWHASYWRHLAAEAFGSVPTDDQDKLWQQSQFGDGTDIPDETIRKIVDAYEEQEYSVPWRKNDILYFDNMLVSHGRKPFAGRRSILVSFRSPLRAVDLPLHA